MAPVAARRAWILPAAAACVLAAGGCAAGRQHTYDDARLRLYQRGSHSVAVATRDERAYVVGGEKAPDFTGVQRSGLGVPFDVTTRSGRPLADDFTAVILRALGEHGYGAQAVAAPPGQPLQQTMAALAATRAQRLMVVRMFEWKADTYQSVGLRYHLVLDVFDEDGRPLGQSMV